MVELQQDERLRAAQADIARLQKENDELADEVLRSYEQINFIFDLSAQVAILTDAKDVHKVRVFETCQYARFLKARFAFHDLLDYKEFVRIAIFNKIRGLKEARIMLR